MKFRYLLPAILWSLLILWVLSVPGSSFPKTPFLAIPHFDKLVHLGIFAVFTFLLGYGLSKQPARWCQKYVYTITLLLGVIYSMLTEVVQHIFLAERTGDFWDFIADVAGCLVGILILKHGKQYLPAFMHK